GKRDRLDEERNLGRLFHAAHRSDEADSSRYRQQASEAPRCLRWREHGQLTGPGLERSELSEVYEPRQRADRPGKEGRSGTRRPDDENKSVVEASQALGERGCAARSQSLGDPQLETC